MRILWLSSCFRANALIRREGLLAAGAETLVVSTNRGFSSYSGPPRDYERILLGRPVPWADWGPCYRTYREVKEFKPDVVATELIADPRWRSLAGDTPRINLVHDAKPHDEKHKIPVWNRLMFDRWNARADATVVFSEYVRGQLIDQGRELRRLRVVPLHSDLHPALVPTPVRAEERKNFIMFGRHDSYKNHAVIFAAWDAHVASDAWRGDELLIYGGGDIPLPLPAHARWVRREFTYEDVVDEFARAKGSIVHHTEGASQSGVQILSMQLGIPTLVSTGGALPEYQPEGLNVTAVDDVEGLTRAISALADPSEVEVQSRLVRDHYRRTFDSSLFARRFIDIANEIKRR